MIVLDENLQDFRIRDAIAQWYQGQVTSIRRLRPSSVIKDDAISTLLQHAKDPTFVTINITDFWLKALASPRYCIIAFDIPKEQSLEIPLLLRGVLRLDLFTSKASRMGKIIRWTPTYIEYYEPNRRVVRLEQD